MARKTGSHAETTGPLIRKAAQRLFAQQGFAAVSMRQIAGEVGLQAGALYLYTPDKQTLLLELMKDHLEDLLATWKRVDLSGDPMADLETFCRFHIEQNLERPDAVFIAYMELRNLTPENFEIIEEHRRAYERELTSILEKGVKSGAFIVPDTKLAALAIIAMLNGVNTWYREGGRLSRDSVATIYWDMVRRSVEAENKNG